MKMKILFACMALLCMANRAPAQAFFPEGTRWTELRLDTREHQTWCDEEKRDGGSVLVPNYEQIEYYVQGDSTDEVCTYRYVWRHMEGKPDSIAFVISEDANEVMVTQPFYETLDGMEIFRYFITLCKNFKENI